MSTKFRIMSFNVQVASNIGDRGEGVTSIVRDASPELLGIQEANGVWMDHLSQSLADIYDFVYLGRDNTARGEGTPIFFKRETFEAITTGTKWLGEVPDQPIKTEGARYPRVMSYAELRFRTSGERIVFVSTHLDHAGDDVAALQAAHMKRIVGELFGEDAPIFIVGDFNVLPDSKTLTYMTGEFGLTSVSNSPEITDDTPTFHRGIKIDYCMYRESAARPLSYKVINEYEGGYPSDHYAICADFELK